MLHIKDDSTCILQVEKEHTVQGKMRYQYYLWEMYFDDSSCKEGAGVGIVLISTRGEIISLMYKLELQKTNNIVEYEALVLGLRAAKDLTFQQLTMFGDSELIVQQVKDVYHVKQPLLKVYQNRV